MVPLTILSIRIFLSERTTDWSGLLANAEKAVKAEKASNKNLARPPPEFVEVSVVANEKPIKQAMKVQNRQKAKNEKAKFKQEHKVHVRGNLRKGHKRF